MFTYLDCDGPEGDVPCGEFFNICSIPLSLNLSQMLSHAGTLNFREMKLPTIDCQSNPEAAWKVWKDHESRSR